MGDQIRAVKRPPSKVVETTILLPMDERKSRFLAALGQHWSVVQAAQAVGASPSWFYRARRDPAFAAAWKLLTKGKNKKTTKRKKIKAPKRNAPPSGSRPIQNISKKENPIDANVDAFHERPMELVLRVYRGAETVKDHPPRPVRSLPKSRRATPIERLQPSDKTAPSNETAPSNKTASAERKLTDDERAHRVSELLHAARARRAGPAASE